MSIDFKIISNQVNLIAIEAGKILLKYWNIDKGIITKDSDINLVTKADKESEAYIVSELKNKFQEFGVIGEEGTNIKTQNGYYWLIDPLDGTTSFAHNFPLFAVSIALMDENHNPVLGVVYNPYYKELFYGIKGMGSFLNDEKIKVSSIESLNKSLIATGFPYNRREIMDLILSKLKNILMNVHDVRRSGSAALDICFVASGRVEGYYEQGLQPWDTAAALIIAQEAGAMATQYNGNKVDVYTPNFVISNGRIHNELLLVLNNTI